MTTHNENNGKGKQSFLGKARDWVVKYAIEIYVVAAAAIIYYFRLNGYVALDVDLSFDDYSTLLTNVAFIAILAERFNEAFVGAHRWRGKQKFIKDLKHAKKNNGDVPKAEAALEEYRADTAELIMKIALAIGVIASLAGVRVLQVLFDTTDLPSGQGLVFSFIDVLLTAGLIAGGSKGVNKVSALLAAHMETQRDNARERKPTES